MPPRSVAPGPAPYRPSHLPRLGLIASLLLALAQAPAASQAVNDFRLPPGAGQPTPAPAGPPAGDLPPRPLPEAAPEPSPSPSSAPAVTLPPAPEPPPPRPEARRTDSAPPAAGPTRRERETSAPIASASTGRVRLPDSAGAAGAAITPLPADRPRPPAAPVPAAPGNRSPWRLAALLTGLAAGLLLAGLLLAGLAHRRRARDNPRRGAQAPRDRAGAPRPGSGAAPPEPGPAPPPHSPRDDTAAASVHPAPAPAAAPEIAFEAVRLTLSLRYATLQYRLTLSGGGMAAPARVAAGLDMIAAHASLGAAELLLGDAEPRHDGWQEPGRDLVWTGELRLPLDRIPPLRQGASALFVPLVRITLAADGEPLRRIALVIGEPPADPAGRLAPIRLEAGPRVVQSLAARQLDPAG